MQVKHFWSHVYICKDLFIFHVVKLNKCIKSTSTLYYFEQSTYEELDLQVQNFTLDLLNQCRTSEEVRSLLNSTEMADANTSSFPLLQVALQMEQKKVFNYFRKTCEFKCT